LSYITDIVAIGSTLSLAAGTQSALPGWDPGPLSVAGLFVQLRGPTTSVPLCLYIMVRSLYHAATIDLAGRHV
jgi:hypothetical protein